MTKKIVFSHGKESGPWGSKIKAMAEVARKRGFQVESLDYTNEPSPENRAKKLINHLKSDQGNEQLVLAGSSMGSYVSTLASRQLMPDGLFLLAPAFYLPGYEEQEPAPFSGKTAIIHGWNDQVVPVENAIRFARTHKATLHLLNGDHRLTEEIPEICRLLDLFLETLSA